MFKFKGLLAGVAVAALLVTANCAPANAASSTSKFGVITGNVVNVRNTPSLSGKVLTKISKGASVSVVATSKSWCKITFSGKTGWVSADYLTSYIGTGIVTAKTLNVRSKASTSASVSAKLNKGNKVMVYTRSGSWYKVQTEGGKTGWVINEYLTVKKSSISRGGSFLREESSTGDSIVSYAKNFLGIRYVYGGNTPSTGFDCSGFTKYVYAHFNISIERTAAEQARQGSYVNKGDLQSGDLVFFDTNGNHNHINHVGIYIGGGRFIHASSPRYDVTITDLSDSYYLQSYMTARRITR